MIELSGAFNSPTIAEFATSSATAVYVMYSL